MASEDPVETLRDFLKLGKQVFLYHDKVAFGDQTVPKDTIVDLPRDKRFVSRLFAYM
jgi:hypothetical protein